MATNDTLISRFALPAALGCAALLCVQPVPPALAQSDAGTGTRTSTVFVIAQFDLAALPDEPFWEEDGQDSVDPVLAVPSFLAPDLDKSFAFRERAARSGLARPELETVTIRRGLGAASAGPYAATERAVGIRLGPQPLSLETAIVSGSGTWQSADTRLDWTLVRRATIAETGLLWSLSTGGGFGTAGAGSQNATAMLGYRYSLFDNVTLTSEIALASSYAFAGHAMPEAKLTPQVQIVTDLSRTLSTPWRTVLDVKMNREVPLAGGEYQSNASAMLRFQFRAD